MVELDLMLYGDNFTAWVYGVLHSSHAKGEEVGSKHGTVLICKITEGSIDLEVEPDHPIKVIFPCFCGTMCEDEIVRIQKRKVSVPSAIEDDEVGLALKSTSMRRIIGRAATLAHQDYMADMRRKIKEPLLRDR